MCGGPGSALVWRLPLDGELPAGARDDDAGIGRALVEDEAGEQVLNRRHTQRDERSAWRSPLLRGDCRARIAARKAWA